MKKISSRPLDSIWLKASVVGSSWASIEIIFGSFLHNLRIPMSGTLLSFISVFLLVSFIQIWREKGLIIRAGLICALMKSISPSAIILGPMTGILMEAALIELSVQIFGLNLAGYIPGGALAVMSTLLHKLVSLIIMFGFDFIKILDVLYQYSVKQIRLKDSDPLNLILLITAIYAITGATGACLGYISGKKYLRRRHLIQGHPDIVLETGTDLFPGETERKYSIALLILIFLSIVTSLLLINLNLAVPAAVFSILFVLFCLLHYKTSLKRLKRISLWFQFAFITLIAAFLWNGISEKNLFSVTGLMTGLKMVARATIVVMGFAAISSELKNPLVRSILYKRGFENLYRSLTIAFSALPGIIAGLPKTRKLFGKSGISFPSLFRQAEGLLQKIENEHASGPSVIIVTGEPGQGKTTFVRNIVDCLKKENFPVGGFLAPGIEKGNIRTGFNIQDIHSSQLTGLCTSVPHEKWLNYGKYYFDPEGIAKGKEILDTHNIAGKALIVIDEVGPVELKGEGWAGPLVTLNSSSAVPQLWVVRRSLADRVIKKWAKGDVYIFSIIEDSPGKILELIAEITGYKKVTKD